MRLIILDSYLREKAELFCKLHDGKLTMYPNGPVWCIEGCGQRFVKLEDLSSN